MNDEGTGVSRPLWGNDLVVRAGKTAVHSGMGSLVPLLVSGKPLSWALVVAPFAAAVSAGWNVVTSGLAARRDVKRSAAERVVTDAVAAAAKFEADRAAAKVLAQQAHDEELVARVLAQVAAAAAPTGIPLGTTASPSPSPPAVSISGPVV